MGTVAVEVHLRHYGVDFLRREGSDSIYLFDCCICVFAVFKFLVMIHIYFERARNECSGSSSSRVISMFASVRVPNEHKENHKHKMITDKLKWTSHWRDEDFMLQDLIEQQTKGP